MRCPSCGAWNRASLPRCQKCGEPLDNQQQTAGWQSRLNAKTSSYIRMDEDGDAIDTPDARDALAQEMTELKTRKVQGTRQQRRLRQESAARGAAPSGMTIRTHQSVDTFWSVQDDPSETVRLHAPDRPQGKRTDAQFDDVDDGERAPSWEEDRATWDPMWSEHLDYAGNITVPTASGYRGKRLPSRSRRLRRLMYTALTILGVAAVLLAVYFAIVAYSAHREHVSSQNRAIVTASIVNDLAAHTILIPGQDGQQIYIRELHTSYMVTGGFATVEIEDHIWYDDIQNFVAETYEVTLTPFVKSSSGQQKPLDLIHYTVDVPLSPIRLISPDGTRTEVASQLYNLSFEVRPGSTVYMNNVDISDTVNSVNGTLSYNATVQPIGDNVFTLRVRSQYCRENQLSITLYREVQEIPLDLAAETYTSTTLQKLQVKATTIPGADVDVLSPYSDLDITNLNTTGEFSFYAIFDHIGDNTITVTASAPGKKTSVVNYNVYYIPTESVYSRKAWPLEAAEYAELVSNIPFRASRNQVYVVADDCAYIVSDKPQMAVFYTGENKTQPVLVENFTKTTWEVGKYYRIYADVYGTYDGMPWLCARYTHEK